jgi:hypothetical protein
MKCLTLTPTLNLTLNDGFDFPAGSSSRGAKVWKKAYDENYQHYFWFNVVTQESIWFQDEDETKEDWELVSESSSDET